MKDKIEQEELFLTTREVAERFRVDQATVINWIKKGLFGDGNVIKTLGGNGHYRISNERVFSILNGETDS